VAHVGRLAKRRAIRRAADEALTIQVFDRPYAVRSPLAGSAPGSFRGYGDSHGPWTERDDPEIPQELGDASEPVDDLFDDRPVSVLSDVGTLATGRVRPPRSNPVKPIVIVLAVAAVAALLGWGGLALLRGPDAAVEPTTVAPAPSNSPSAPSTIQPTQASVPVPPPAPPPPPPPPPPPEQVSPGPGYTGSNQWPRSSSPSQSQSGPQLNVTRAPMSVAPTAPRQGPKTNSATPGDAPRRGRWGF
jgi:hypothetical protein